MKDQYKTFKGIRGVIWALKNRMAGDEDGASGKGYVTLSECHMADLENQMEEYDLEKGAKEDLDRIIRDAKRCRDTVKELLEFTRQTRHLMRGPEASKKVQCVRHQHGENRLAWVQIGFGYPYLDVS